MSSRIKISLNSAELNQWRPSWWGDAGGGLDTSPTKKPLSQKPLYTGRLKGNTRVAAQRTPYGGQQREKLRRWGRPGRTSSSWQRTVSCGGSTLLPYMSLKRRGSDKEREQEIELPPLSHTRRHYLTLAIALWYIQIRNGCGLFYFPFKKITFFLSIILTCLFDHHVLFFLAWKNVRNS